MLTPIVIASSVDADAPHDGQNRAPLGRSPPQPWQVTLGILQWALGERAENAEKSANAENAE